MGEREEEKCSGLDVAPLPNKESLSTTDEENLDQAPSYVTQNYFKTHRGENRWKSFRKT